MICYRTDRLFFFISLLLFTIFAGSLVYNIHFGGYCNDEGHYLYAADLAIKGNIPYKDFAYWQPPLILYIYGPLNAIFGNSLILSRYVSALFSLTAFILMASIVIRSGGAVSLIILSLIICLNPSYIVDVSQVRTQSLTILLYCLSINIITLPGHNSSKYFFSSIMMALAVGSRAPLLPMLITYNIYVFFESAYSKKISLITTLISTGTILAGFVFFYLLSDGMIMFGLLDFYKYTGTYTSFFDRSYLEQLIGWQMVPYTLLICTIIFVVYKGIVNYEYSEGSRRIASGYGFEIFAFLSYISISAVHFIAPVKYATHQTTNLPLAAMFLSIVIGNFLRKREKDLSIMVFSALLSLTFISFIFQPVISDRSGGRSPISEYKDIIKTIRPFVSERGKILSFDVIIAYEGGFELLDGLTLGPESHFGEFQNTEKTKKYKGVDNAILKTYFSTRAADVVILQQRDLEFIKHDRTGVGMNEVLRELHRNYKKIATFDNIGQFRQRTLCFALSDIL